MSVNVKHQVYLRRHSQFIQVPVFPVVSVHGIKVGFRICEIMYFVCDRILFVVVILTLSLPYACRDVTLKTTSESAKYKIIKVFLPFA